MILYMWENDKQILPRESAWFWTLNEKEQLIKLED